MSHPCCDVSRQLLRSNLLRSHIFPITLPPGLVFAVSVPYEDAKLARCAPNHHLAVTDGGSVNSEFLTLREQSSPNNQRCRVRLGGMVMEDTHLQSWSDPDFAGPHLGTGGR